MCARPSAAAQQLAKLFTGAIVAINYGVTQCEAYFILNNKNALILSRRGFLATAASLALTGAHVQARPNWRRVRTPHWTDVEMHIIGGRERQFTDAFAKAVAAMDKHGITHAVVLPPPSPKTGIVDYTDYVPVLRKYPGRFGFLGGGGTLNAMIQRYRKIDRISTLVRQHFADEANRILDAGAAGFGEMAALHLSVVPTQPYEQVSLEHPLFRLLVDIAGKHRAVIDLHLDTVTGMSIKTPHTLRVPPNPPVLKGNIDGLEHLLAYDRNARIVWAHGGSDHTGDMTPALIGKLMDRHPNLYMSLRPLPIRLVHHMKVRIYNLILTRGPGGIDRAWLALLHRHSDRFIMGGDTFFTASSVQRGHASDVFSRTNEARLIAAGILLSRLPPTLAKKIGTDNAAQLYRI